MFATYKHCLDLEVRVGESDQQVGLNRNPRVHHVVWCVTSESLPKLQRYWEEALGVPLAKFDVEAIGISVLMSWEAGVEIIAPLAGATEPTPFEVFLVDKGESVFSAVYEVDDLDAAVKQAVANGAKVFFEELIEPETLALRVGWGPDQPRVRVRQALLEEFHGASVCLQESREV
jgi:predicted enzyme related to lactoylglutathione lyase